MRRKKGGRKATRFGTCVFFSFLFDARAMNATGMPGQDQRQRFTEARSVRWPVVTALRRRVLSWLDRFLKQNSFPELAKPDLS
jgi:hypothetical protein